MQMNNKSTLTQSIKGETKKNCGTDGKVQPEGKEGREREGKEGHLECNSGRHEE